jgi:perosamine synthetase
MWFRLRPDIRYADLACALRFCLAPARRQHILDDLDQLWAGSDHSLACLSVRTGFDLLLQTLALPAGSEVLVTALTIPDMVTIIQRHNLVPVPVDIHPDTLAPDPDDLRASVTARTRAVVITHLFGAQIPIEPVLDALGGRSILLIEDCAQAFQGPRGYLGHPAADVSLFSFGPIKTATALGGALLRVKDGGFCRRLKAAEALLPLQRRRQFFVRVCKYTFLKWLTGPRVWSLVAGCCQKAGMSYEPALRNAARSFGGPQDLLTKIRHRPSVPLLALLRRRLARFDSTALERRRSNGQKLSQLIRSDMAVPGFAAARCSYWLFPIASPCRAEWIARLRKEGFDAAQHHTLGVVPRNDSSQDSNERAARLLNDLMFVPAGPSLPESELARLAQCLVVLQTDHQDRLHVGASSDEVEARSR